MNIQKDWKAILESAYSFMLKYSKITVWSTPILEEFLPEKPDRFGILILPIYSIHADATLWIGLNARSF